MHFSVLAKKHRAQNPKQRRKANAILTPKHGVVVPVVFISTAPPQHLPFSTVSYQNQTNCGVTEKAMLVYIIYLRTVGTKARGVEGSRGRGGRAATQRFCATSAKCCWLSQSTEHLNKNSAFILTRTREESNSLFQFTLQIC